MKKSLTTLFAISALSLSTGAFALEEDRDLSLSSKGLKSFFIDSGAGFLEVEGRDGVDSIRVEANIYVEDLDKDEAAEWFEDNMKLSLTEKDGRAVLKAHFESQSSFLGWNNRERKIDLRVIMPKKLDLEVDDGSGWTKVSDIDADVFIDDGSGNLDIENINGNLKVDDGSGNLTIENVQGDLWVDDGSGNLEVDQISGSVEIEDGSGGIRISNIAKDVYIDDGSGSVYACNIDNKLTVDDGSGSVKTCSEFKGKLVVK